MDFHAFEIELRRLFPFVCETQVSRFRELDALYREWNSRINVISRKDMDGLYLHHVLHSLTPALADQTISSGDSVLDLGCGGGFPGIPLAILFPEARFTLCDSIGKKIIVVREIAGALGLDNVLPVNARAEELPESFDWVVSRAVSSFENFMPWVKGRYTKGILYLKGGDVISELSAAKIRNYRLYPISDWIQDNYFEEKFVVEIPNNFV